MKINDLRVYLYTATKNASLNYISKKAKQIELEPYENLQVQMTDVVNKNWKIFASAADKRNSFTKERNPPAPSVDRYGQV